MCVWKVDGDKTKFSERIYLPTARNVSIFCTLNGFYSKIYRESDLSPIFHPVTRRALRVNIPKYQKDGVLRAGEWRVPAIQKIVSMISLVVPDDYFDWLFIFNLNGT
ncbi:hypothetical protein [Desulfopila aestuarii]|nr:hypothetical protein [Desulfopila aestuarii]